VFDEACFHDASFERQSWLMSTLATVRREVVRLPSAFWRVVTLQSMV